MSDLTIPEYDWPTRDQLKRKVDQQKEPFRSRYELLLEAMGI